MDTTICPNCGSPDARAYCPVCGQSQRDPRVSLGAWLAEFLDDQLALSAKLPRTLGMLIRRPGMLPVEWREGRRARYVGPLRLYLLASLVFFSTAFLLGLPLGHLNLARLQPLSIEIPTSADALANTVLAARSQAFMTLAVATLVPLLALWLRWRYRGTGLFYVDHLVFSLYVHASVLFGLTLTYVLLFLPRIGWYAGAVMVVVTGLHAFASFREPRRKGAGRLRKALARTWTTMGWGALLLGGVLATGMYVGSIMPVAWNAGKRDHAAQLYGLARGADTRGDSVSARVLGAAALVAFEAVDSTFLAPHDDFHLAELQLLAGHPDRARAAATALVANHPLDPLVLGLAGRAALATGDTAGARAYFCRLTSTMDAGATVVRGHEASLEHVLDEARALLGTH